MILIYGIMVIKKKELHLSVNVFSTKVLIGDTIFYARVYAFAGHRKCLPF